MASGHSTNTLPQNLRERGYGGGGSGGGGGGGGGGARDSDRLRLSRSVTESRDSDARSLYGDRGSELERSLYSERDRGYLSDMSSRYVDSIIINLIQLQLII